MTTFYPCCQVVRREHMFHCHVCRGCCSSSRLFAYIYINKYPPSHNKPPIVWLTFSLPATTIHRCSIRINRFTQILLCLAALQTCNGCTSALSGKSGTHHSHRSRTFENIATSNHMLEHTTRTLCNPARDCVDVLTDRLVGHGEQEMYQRGTSSVESRTEVRGKSLDGQNARP